MTAGATSFQPSRFSPFIRSLSCARPGFVAALDAAVVVVVVIAVSFRRGPDR